MKKIPSIKAFAWIGLLGVAAVLVGCGGGSETDSASKNGASIDAVSEANLADNKVSSSIVATALASDAGTGLMATYFSESNFTGTTQSRLDPTINFDWGMSEPVPGVGDTFAAQWRGYIQSQYSETYTFRTTSDDGIRVKINGQTVIENWTSHAPTDNSGSIALVAGQKYDIAIDYFDSGSGAVAKLAWSSPSQIQQIVPTSALFPTTAVTSASLSDTTFGNAGFESGLQDWGSLATTVITTPVYIGKQAVRISGEPIWSWGGISRTLVGLQPNTQYRLKAYGKKGQGPLGMIYAVNFGGADQSALISSDAYAVYTLTFTTGAESSSVDIGAGVKSGAVSDHFFVDDFALERLSPANGYQSLNTLDTVINDMTGLVDDAKPNGVPANFWWYKPVRYKAFYTPTTNYPLDSSPAHTWNSLTGWGQLYEAADAQGKRINTATNSRVQLRDMRTYYLSKKDSRWHLLQSSKGVDGSAYREDFAGDIKVTPNLRKEADGSVSVIPGGGYNFHFWPSAQRPELADPADVAAVFVTVKSRLIADNPAVAFDSARAAFVMDLGGDIWYDQKATWDNWKTNGDFGMSRFKKVTPAWQSYSLYAITSTWDYTQTAAIIRANPPPLE